MILPTGINDLATASLEEIVAAYVRDGVDLDAARYMAKVLKNEVPPDEVVD